MRIWYINHYASTPDQPMTGAYYLMQSLAHLGNEVTVFASGFNYYRRRDLALKGKWFMRREKQEAIEFCWIRTTPTSGAALSRLVNMLSFSLLTLCIGLFQRRPDVIIGVCPHPFAGAVAWLLAKRHGAKFVYEVRDIWPESMTQANIFSADHPLARMLAALQRFLYSHADLVASVLICFDRYLKERSIPYRRFLWIPNGAPIEGDAPPAAKEKTISASESMIAMYLGGHSKYQKLDTLLDAALVLKQKNAGHIRIVFVGDGSEKPRLMERARDMQLSNVEFRDAVPRSEVRQVAALADVFILHFQAIPLLQYGISNNKLCDYMLTGRPVVFGAEAVNNAVADCDGGITVPPETPGAMADALIALAGLPFEKRRAMGERARAYALEHFDVAKQAQKLHQALHNLP